MTTLIHMLIALIAFALTIYVPVFTWLKIRRKK